MKLCFDQKETDIHIPFAVPADLMANTMLKLNILTYVSILL